MTARSAQSLFKAVSGGKVIAGGTKTRHKHDYDPTPPEATSSLLLAEGNRLRKIGGPIWEPAVGGGHMAREMKAHGFDVIGSDLIDRGHPGTIVKSFMDFDAPPLGAKIIITNPPYMLVNARDGKGAWVKQMRAMGVEYAALLLNWDWIAARMNGMDALHTLYPVSRAYVCTWKIDFTGEGSPPQRNGWIIWDLKSANRPTELRRMFKGKSMQDPAIVKAEKAAWKEENKR
jgi:hypothetical protein